MVKRAAGWPARSQLPEPCVIAQVWLDYWFGTSRGSRYARALAISVFGPTATRWQHTAFRADLAEAVSSAPPARPLEGVLSALTAGGLAGLRVPERQARRLCAAELVELSACHRSSTYRCIKITMQRR